MWVGEGMRILLVLVDQLLEVLALLEWSCRLEWREPWHQIYSCQLDPWH